MSRIHIALPPPASADYDVVVEPGALTRIAAHVAESAPAHRYAIIADANVADLYGETAQGALASAGLSADLHVFPPGEEHKSRETWAALTDLLLDSGIGRDGVVVGIGGGVTGDLAGFVAATYMRGIPIVQVPTSLLAMVDASVGGKTGVDSPHGKNLIGAFLQPRRVIGDPAVLATLPDRELRCGLAEAVKHGAIADPDYLSWIESHAESLLAREPEVLATLVVRSVEIKASFVAADPLEGGARKSLNFGHTIAHAVEAVAGFTMPHGYAVSIGMVIEAAAGEAAGITEAGTAASLQRILEACGLPTGAPDAMDAQQIIVAARTDKKAREARARYALIERLGRVARTDSGDWTHTLDEALIRRAWAGSGGRTGGALKGIYK